MGTIEIREALISDSKEIAKVHVSTWQSAYHGIMPDSFLNDLSVESRESSWSQLLESPAAKAHTFVAVSGNSIVGFIGVGPNRLESDSSGELFAIYVSPNFQGRGAGSKHDPRRPG